MIYDMFNNIVITKTNIIKQLLSINFAQLANHVDYQLTRTKKKSYLYVKIESKEDDQKDVFNPIMIYSSLSFANSLICDSLLLFDFSQNLSYLLIDLTLWCQRTNQYLIYTNNIVSYHSTIKSHNIKENIKSITCYVSEINKFYCFNR